MNLTAEHRRRIREKLQARCYTDETMGCLSAALDDLDALEAALREAEDLCEGLWSPTVELDDLIGAISRVLRRALGEG